jgi:hypothetical protein
MSGLTFERFRNLQHFAHAIPIPPGERSIHNLLKTGPRKLALAHAVPEIDIEFVAMEMQFFAARVELQKTFACLFGGFGSKKGDKQSGGINPVPAGERISDDNPAHFGGGTQNHVGAEAEFALDGLLNPLRKAQQIFLVGEKDHVAALNESLGRFEFKRFVKRAERLHLDFVVAADIDAAQHGNDRGHFASKYTA